MMKEFPMYSKIKDLERKGFTARQTARILKINRKTVAKYRAMSLEEFMDYLTAIRKLSSLDELRPVILDWLHAFPSMTSAQVHDWILEHYPEREVSERTVSRYVRNLRLDFGIPKSAPGRSYEAMDELPMGHQIQLDFGVKNMPLMDRQGSRKVYFVGMILAHSRYKWGYFQTRPFTSGDLIRAMIKGFEFFGGSPKEIAIDQDSIIVVSENKGDIIYTHEFEQFKSQVGLNIWLCHKADPESKGMVESTVKFVKGNFLPNRFFMEEDDLNESFLGWLKRTGNAKGHGTTKKVPAQVFELEREHLRAVQTKNYNLNPSIKRTVRKDNTILYNSNRYSLPQGTYTKHAEVTITATDGTLTIYDAFGDILLAIHTISPLRGTLIKLTEHRRDKSASLDKLEAQVLEGLDSQIKDQWQGYLRLIRERKPRYYRDHLTLLGQLTSEFPFPTLEEAMLYCSERELYSVNDLKSAAEYIGQQPTVIQPPLLEIQPITNPTIVNLSTQKRKLSDYQNLGGGDHE